MRYISLSASLNWLILYSCVFALCFHGARIRTFYIIRQSAPAELEKRADLGPWEPGPAYTGKGAEYGRSWRRLNVSTEWVVAEVIEWEREQGKDESTIDLKSLKIHPRWWILVATFLVGYIGLVFGVVVIRHSLRSLAKGSKYI